MRLLKWGEENKKINILEEQIKNLKEENYSYLDELEMVYKQLQSTIEESNITYTEFVSQIKKLNELFTSTIRALATALDARDPYTKGHSERVAQYSLCIGRYMGLSGKDLDILERGALLHDIGKIGIRDNILLKPGPLTAEEWVIMRSHIIIGANIISPIEQLQEVALLVKYNHERWDGMGYPEGLTGEEIPLGARIITLTDALDTITTDRPYRRALSWAYTLNEVKKGSGKHFDPEVVEAFFSIMKSQIIPILPESVSVYV